MRALLAALLLAVPAHAQEREEAVADDFRRTLECPRVTYCTRVSTCREAVHLWCVCGYEGADGDGKGVPCEQWCGDESPETLARVARIKESLGCR